MGTGRTKIASVVLCAAVILGAGATIASATRTVRLGSKISISGKGLTFKGRVTSSSVECEAARAVALYRTNGLKLGTTTTSPTGRWKLTVSGSAGITLGHFYAKAKQQVQGTAGTIFVCKAATSRTIPYKP
jgi:hypothetical protein